jgi:ribonuclease E
MSNSAVNDPDLERWRELAEVLGLPPDERGPSAAPAVPVASSPGVAANRSWEPAPTSQRLSPKAEEIAAELPAPEPVEELPTRDADSFTEAADSFAEAAEAVEEVERGRRRGRRGRRERSRRDRDERARERPLQEEQNAEEPSELAAAIEPAEVAEPIAEEAETVSGKAEEPAKEERSGRRRRRSRRRGRRADTAPEAPAGEETPHEEVVAPAALETEEDEDNLADWDVPSWNELIASLYRPER